MSQKTQILKHLQGGHPLTALDALTKFGCFRLASRIGELRAEGHKILSEIVVDLTTGKKYAEYWIPA
jgi:hypothetical protein